MAGIPDFLQKYLSYNPPSQEKYITQMNNVPDFLQKYIGGSVGLGQETTLQPTMGELGYLQQKSPAFKYSREFAKIITSLPKEKQAEFAQAQTWWFNRLNKDIGEWFNKYIPQPSAKVQRVAYKASDIAAKIAIPFMIAEGLYGGLSMLESLSPYAYSDNPILRTLGKAGQGLQNIRININNLQQTANKYKKAVNTFEKLGVKPNTEGYRKLIKTYHPDINPEYQELAQQINDAYSTIEQVNRLKKAVGLSVKILSNFVKANPQLALKELPASIDTLAKNTVDVVNELQKVDPAVQKVFGTEPLTLETFIKNANKYTPKLTNDFAFSINDLKQSLATAPLAKKPSNTVNLTLYHADTGMGKLTHITYATGHPEIAKTYGANVKAYKVSLPEKNILHIDYKMPTNPLYDYSYKIVDGRKIDFHLITPEDKKFLLDRGYKAIDVTKIDTDGKKIPHFEFVALDKSILNPIKKEVLPPEIPKEPSIIKTTQTFLQKYHKGTTPDILGTPDYEALKEVKQSPEKTLEILRKDYAKIQKNIDTAEQMFLDNKIDALTARKKIAEQLQLIKKLKTLNPYGKNEKITQLNDKALKYAKTKLDKIKLTKIPTTTHSLSKQEQEELTKKGLTNLQPNNDFVYIGIRNPETLKKILEAGQLKVDKTSEKMGIFGSHHLAIAKDYAKKTGVIFKIPYDKTADISNKIDQRLKQVRLNKDIDLSKAFVKVGNKWVKFREYKKKIKLGISKTISTQLQPVAKEQVKKPKQTVNQLPIEQALQKDVKIEDEAKRSGNISLNLLKEVKSKLADFFVTANKLRGKDINLWYIWREQMFKVNASVEKWTALFEKHMKGYWTPISAKDDYDMAILFDAGEKPMFTGDKLKMYNRMAELNKKLEEYKLKKDLTGRFQDADITLLDEQIAELEKKGTAKALAKANELSQLRDKIAKMNYLPRKAILNKYWGASPEKREAFLKKLKNTDLLSSSYKHRKSKSLLAELVNKGVLQPEDISFIEMTVENYVETGMKEAMRETYQIFEKNGMIQKASNELKLQGWISPYKLGIKDPYLKEKLFHPALAQAFEQYIASQKPHNWLLRILGIVKVAQFIKPNIVWFYDIAQILFRGLYSFNPVVNGKLMKQALESVKNKDDLYLHLLEKGLYPMPEGIPNKILAEEYSRFARRHITDVSQFKKTLEMLAGHTITTKDKDLFNIAMEVPRIYVDPLAKVTWQGDKVMRTFGYLQAKKMGYDDDKAIRITREALGDYSVLSNKYKEIASYIFFVYAFRILMPVEMTKTLFIEPMRFLIKKITGNDPPKGEAERILKALLGFFALVYIPYRVMKHFGFKPTGKHLGPLAWKYAKPVLYKGKKKEIVVGYNNIVNMPIKYWNRFTSYDPTNPTSPFLQVIWRVGKWEIQPLYRIAIEIAFNKPSFSTKPYVYNENDPWEKQVADMVQYLFEQSFRFYATLDDLTSAKTSYAKQQQEVIDTNMKLFEKVLINTFGYSYVRSSRDYIKKIMLTQLKAERTKRLHKIFKNYTGDKRKNEIDKLNSWYKRSLQYINKHY